MTTAPPVLLAVRSLLLQHLPGLADASVGIVGDPDHRGGYHCGVDRVRRDDSGTITDYSVVESSRDRTGLTDQACALDIGSFLLTVGGKRHDLRSFSIWLVSQCKAGTPDTADIREVIYSTDGQTVRRWDRLGIRTTGDSSHRWHTHISYHRDAIRAGRDQTGLIRRYLTTIGLLAREDTDMLTDDDVKRIAGAVAGWVYGDGRALYSHARDADRQAGMIRTELTALREQVAAIQAGGVTDDQLERVLRRVIGSVDGASPA